MGSAQTGLCNLRFISFISMARTCSLPLSCCMWCNSRRKLIGSGSFGWSTVDSSSPNSNGRLTLYQVLLNLAAICLPTCPIRWVLNVFEALASLMALFQEVSEPQWSPSSRSGDRCLKSRRLNPCLCRAGDPLLSFFTEYLGIGLVQIWQGLKRKKVGLHYTNWFWSSPIRNLWTFSTSWCLLKLKSFKHVQVGIYL